MIRVQGIARNVLLVIGTILILFLVWYFSSLVTYILISAVLSLIGRPVVRFLTGVKIWRFKVSTTLSAFVTLVLFWVFLLDRFGF